MLCVSYSESVVTNSVLDTSNLMLHTKKVMLFFFAVFYLKRQETVVIAYTGVLVDILLCSFFHVSSIDSLPLEALYFCAAQNDTNNYC